MDAMEGTYMPRVLISRKEKSWDPQIYVKLTYDPNVNRKMHIKLTTDVRTMYTIVLREWIGEGVWSYQGYTYKQGC